MLRKFIFKDSVAAKEVILPITPESFDIDHGVSVETINLNNLGDVNLPGKRYMMTIKIDCMFPAHEYPFANEGTMTEPFYYVQLFEDWCDKNTILRFMITDTNINTTAVIESVQFGEKDGTNDIYCTLRVRQYRVLKPVTLKTEQETKNKARNTEESKTNTKVYTIVKGDSLSSICRKFYGDARLYPKLAVYNGIANPNLIIAGKTLKIPDKSKL